MTSRTVIGRCAGTVSPSIGPVRLDEHPPVGQLRQQLVDRLVEAQPALLDQEQRADGDDRLGHRGDPEDGVAVDRRCLATGEHAAKPTSRSSPHAASQATPPMSPLSTWPAITSSSRFSRAASNPLMPDLTSEAPKLTAGRRRRGLLHGKSR